jgi:orotate phosphoribosyltransferase
VSQEESEMVLIEHRLSGDRVATVDPAILALMHRDGLLREGHFSFRSGRHSAGLLDRDLLLADPGLASRMGYAIAKRFFTEHLNTVATPSIWGAGLAQWVGYFLEPKAKVVDATPADGGLTIAEKLIGFIAGCRVLLVDNLIVSGQTMTQFAEVVSSHGATVVGIATLWSLGPETIAGFPVYALLNDVYPAFESSACPLCAAGAPAPEPVAY